MTDYEDTVKVRITNPKQIENYTPPRGINASWKNLDIKHESADLKLSACDINTNNHDIKYQHDINEELSRLKVIGDRIRDFYSKHRAPLKLTRVETFLDHPFLDHEFDSLRDKATNIHEIKVPEFNLREINKHFESQGLRSLKEKRKTRFNESVFDFGEIT